jgi:hypothetical protein
LVGRPAAVAGLERGEGLDLIQAGLVSAGAGAELFLQLVSF